MYAVEIENLHKSYGRMKVLQGLTLNVEEGEIYGLLGPGGAGKSTLMYLLLGFLKPSKGHLRVLGSDDLEAARGRIGYLPEQLRYHLRYTPREYLFFLGVLSKLDRKHLRQRIEEELTRVGLIEVADRRMATFSKGMVQRVGIAQALLVEPDLLLIDEPTSGLDLVFRHEVLDMLARVRAHGHTILLCTHQLDVIEHICDRVGVLAGGKLAVEVNVSQLRSIGINVTIQVSHLTPELRDRLSSISSAVHCGEYTVNLHPNSHSLQSVVLRTLLESDVEILELESLERPIEHIYLEAVRNASLGLPQTQPAFLSSVTEPRPSSRSEPAQGVFPAGSQGQNQPDEPENPLSMLHKGE